MSFHLCNTVKVWSVMEDSCFIKALLSSRELHRLLIWLSAFHVRSPDETKNLSLTRTFMEKWGRRRIAINISVSSLIFHEELVPHLWKSSSWTSTFLLEESCCCSWFCWFSPFSLSAFTPVRQPAVVAPPAEPSSTKKADVIDLTLESSSSDDSDSDSDPPPKKQCVFISKNGDMHAKGWAESHLDTRFRFAPRNLKARLRNFFKRAFLIS